MDLSNLKYNEGARKKKKRIGRGQGSGRGGTSTKGHKGQKSRAGASIPAWFEGGQMPLMRRIPKFGFTNRNRVEYKPVNVSRLADLVKSGKLDPATDVTPAVLVSIGVIGKNDVVKVLGMGDITVALNIKVDKVTASARTKIEAAGGTVA